MTDLDRHGGTERGETAAKLFAAETDPDTVFPLTPPELRPRDPDTLDLPEHLRGPIRNLLNESSWLQRRIVQDRAHLDRIESAYDRTPSRNRDRRTDLLGRHELVSAGLQKLYQRLIDTEHRLTDLYQQAAKTERERERRHEHPSRDTARDDVIRYPRPPATNPPERHDAATERHAATERAREYEDRRSSR